MPITPNTWSVLHADLHPRQTRVHPLLDHGVLEFGEYPAHLEHGYF
jgi:hypothetical protein